VAGARKPNVRKILSEPLKAGEVRLIRNDTLFDLERDIVMSRDGILSSWSMSNPCSHPLGPYGWITDTLLSGFSAVRSGQDILLYKTSTENGDTEWHWS